MKIFLFSFFFACLFAIGNGSPPLDLYSIDASKRGKDFVSSLTTAFTLAGSAGEVVIQTMASPPFLKAPGVTKGVIPYVQQSTLLAAPNSTLFIIPYNPNGTVGINSNTQYIVVGIEQIVTLAYRPTISPAFPLTGFTSTYGFNVYPLYSIDPSLRAQDIQSIANTLITLPANYNGNKIVSQVWIFTNLNGPYYVPFNSAAPGLIPNVTAISVLANEFLLITYKPNSSPFSGSVIVAAEQIQQIIFYPTNPPAS